MSYIYTPKTLGLLYPHFIGCLSCISVTKKCYQGFLESQLKNLFFSYISYESLISEHLFAYIPCNHSHALHATKELPKSRCARSKNNKLHHKCWFIGFLKGDSKVNLNVIHCQFFEARDPIFDCTSCHTFVHFFVLIKADISSS